jgi:hypothetical protein
MEATIPRGNDEIDVGEHKRRGEVQCVQAAKLSRHRKSSGMLDQVLVDLHDPKRQPLIFEGARGGASGGEANRPSGLDESNAAHEPTVGAVHRVTHEIAASLPHVALDERARVQIDVQRSASRSARTSDEALCRPRAKRGARFGRARDGARRRPSATSSRRWSFSAEARAGTMSATAFPRTVTRTCSPAATARSVSLNDAFSSLTPTSRMWPH